MYQGARARISSLMPDPSFLNHSNGFFEDGVDRRVRDAAADGRVDESCSLDFSMDFLFRSEVSQKVLSGWFC